MPRGEQSSDEARLALVRELIHELHAPPATLQGRVSRWFVRRLRGNGPETDRVAEELRRLAQALIFSASR